MIMLQLRQLIPVAGLLTLAATVLWAAEETQYAELDSLRLVFHADDARAVLATLWAIDDDSTPPVHAAVL